VQPSGGSAALLWLIGRKHCINSLVHGRDKEGQGMEWRQDRRKKRKHSKYKNTHCFYFLVAIVTDEIQTWTTTESRKKEVAIVPDQQSTTTNIPTEWTSPLIFGKIQVLGTSVKQCILISHQRSPFFTVGDVSVMQQYLTFLQPAHQEHSFQCGEKCKGIVLF